MVKYNGSPMRDKDNCLASACAPRTTEMGRKTFYRAKLTDIRRVARVKKVAEARAIHLDVVSPSCVAAPYAVKATYNLSTRGSQPPRIFNQDSGPWCGKRCDRPGVSLFLEDTTAWSWSGQQPMAGRGPIGQSASRTPGLLGPYRAACGWPDRTAGQPQVSARRGERLRGAAIGRADRHVISPERHRQSGANAPERPSLDPTPVNVWGVRRKAWGSGAPTANADIDAYVGRCQARATVV